MKDLVYNQGNQKTLLQYSGILKVLRLIVLVQIVPILRLLHHFSLTLPFSDYSTQQLSDRSDKQDYQQQFGLMDDQSVVGTPDHPSSDFSPSLGLGSSQTGGHSIGHPFSASTASASIIILSLSWWTLLLIINAMAGLHYLV